jgi:non-ribosomal peptide synthase protein (TIGR01720 family)
MSSDLQCFPVDFVAPETKQGDIDVISFEVLDAPSMARMRERFEARHHARVRDLLIACLAFSAHQRTGQQGLSLHVVGHGRHPLYKGIDVSRTSGWFVTHIPVCVKIALQESGRPVSFRAVVESTFAQSDAMPNHGLGFGALRVGAQSTIQEELGVLDQVTTLVNYIGPAMGGRARSPLFDTPDMSTGNRPDPVDPENPTDYLLYVFAYLADGRLRVDICFSTKHYAKATIEELGTDFHRNAHRWVHDALQ